MKDEFVVAAESKCEAIHSGVCLLHVTDTVQKDPHSKERDFQQDHSVDFGDSLMCNCDHKFCFYLGYDEEI